MRPKVKLLRLKIKLLLTKDVKNETKMPLMLTSSRGVDKNIVKENLKKTRQIVPKHSEKKTVHSVWSTGVTLLHNIRIKGANGGKSGGTIYTPRSVSDLIIGRRNVKL
jgi:type I restriction-modification system DNA methylase subunit